MKIQKKNAMIDTSCQKHNRDVPVSNFHSTIIVAK